MGPDGIDVDRVSRAIDIDAPPTELVRPYGPTDVETFKKLGVISADQLVRFAGLEPGHDVLDVGCGIGRVAMPLTRYLSDEATYHGIDPMRDGVSWATRHITPKYPNFTFRHIDVRNAMYNRWGIRRDTKFRFPFPAGRFDVVFLFSVFTHMKPAGLRHYLGEIHRVLKPAGRIFATFFLLDDYAIEAVAEQRVVYRDRHAFKPVDDSYWTSNPGMPEGAIAYPVDRVQAVFDETGFSHDGGVLFGKWCLRPDATVNLGQDAVVATRVELPPRSSRSRGWVRALLGR